MSLKTLALGLAAAAACAGAAQAETAAPAYRTAEKAAAHPAGARHAAKIAPRRAKPASKACGSARI